MVNTASASSLPALVLANLTVPEAGPVELIDAAAAGGFAGVNVWLAPPPALALFAGARRTAGSVVGDAGAVAAMRARCAVTGVRVFAASSGWIAPDFDPATIAPALDTIAALHATAVALVGWDPDRARLVEHLGRVCAAAAERALRVHLEFMPYSAVRSADDALAVLRAVDAPALRILVDVLHLARSGGTAADLHAIPPERVGSLQLCDAAAQPPPGTALRDESVNARLLPGDGALPLHAIFAALPPDVTIELEAPAAALRDLPPPERARRAGDAARRFLATVPGRS